MSISTWCRDKDHKLSRNPFIGFRSSAFPVEPVSRTPALCRHKIPPFPVPFPFSRRLGPFPRAVFLSSTEYGSVRVHLLISRFEKLQVCCCCGCCCCRRCFSSAVFVGNISYRHCIEVCGTPMTQFLSIRLLNPDLQRKILLLFA